MARIVVMGVTGCGKSTVGRGLADALGFEFVDGDDLHPAGNVAKMAAGIPLTDDDRAPWLDRVGAWLAARDDRVIACSALKRDYRDALRAAAPGTVFVHLSAPEAVLAPRVRARHARDVHYAGPALLPSQFADLEQLAPDEEGVVVDVATATPVRARDLALAWIGSRFRPDER